MTQDDLAAFRQSGEFDPRWYLATYPDVGLSGMDPTEHYLRIGCKLGRPPRAGLADEPAAPAALSIELPRAPAPAPVSPAQGAAPAAANPALSSLVSRLRGVHPARGDFNPLSYLLTNPDLVVLGGAEQLAAHWTEHGRGEARQGAGVSRYSERRPWTGPRDPDRLRVAFYGPISAASGLGVASRGYVAALRTLGVELEVVDAAPALYPDRGGTIAMPKAKPDVLILHINPDALGNFFRLVDPAILDDTYVVGAWAWELIAFRPEWIEAFGAVDEVWTLSDFITDAVRAICPVGVQVTTMPPVVEAPCPAAPASRREFGMPEDAFVFLSAFDVSSAFERKNPEAVLEAFSTTFRNDPAAFLVMKYHSSKSGGAQVAAMRRRYEASNILFLDSLMPEDKVAALRQAADCLVSAHRSEGLGLNIAEAMAIGKPVIATGYSGNMEFCDETNALLIPVSMTEVKHGTPHYPAGSVWGEPDGDALAAAMRRVVDDRAFATALGQRAAESVARDLSCQTIAWRIDTALARIAREGLQAMADLPDRARLAWLHPGALGSSEFATGDWPRISVIVPVYNIAPDLLEACVESVLRQTYPHWELCLCDDASTNPATVAYLERLRGRDQRIRIRRLARNGGISLATNAAVELSTGEYVAFLDNDDTIEPDALQCYAEAILQNPGCDLLYCDEDKIDFAGRYVDHYFKPDWSPEHLESCMYVLHMLTVRKRTFLALGGYRAEYTGAQDYDLALRVSRTGGSVVHVPKVLYHWRMIPGSASAEVDAKPDALINARRALADYAEQRYGPDARAEDGLLTGLFRITRGHLAQPPVTLVMTTNNGTKEVEGRGMINLPGNFLQSIVDRTDYPNYRVILSSNGVLSDQARSLLDRIGGREIVYRGSSSPFNFPDKANFSMLAAETEIIVLLNDDMEIRNSGWLGALVDQIVKEDVGAVGAHLCYPDGRIQHAGMVVGVNETCAHIYHGHGGDSVGYNGFTSIVRNYSAVTGACMATKRSLYEQVGGFDRAFGTDFNDIDYCLKLRSLGYRVVYTPFTRLYHFESQTAVRTEQNPQEKALFLSRWQDVIRRDPYYNPNLRRDSITFDPLEHCWPRP
ncbi:glycosyltransferase [Novosphingobium flavum]|uniref:glycosyltransferase n=1 Tax=Novosphingobium aerophilum TaxID=2839843 RepID=UPI00163957FF|nr:glycosyltransferase [Novosphingobium aerophilum]